MKINWALILTGLIFVISFSNWLWLINEGEKFFTYYERGVVTYKSVTETKYKHTTSTNLILYVKYESGEEKQTLVDIRTYETKKVGDKVSFKRLSQLYGLCTLLSFITAFISIIGVGASLVTNDSKESQK